MNEVDVKEQLNKFLIRSGMSKNLLAKTLEIPQSQISNWSNYGAKRWTKNTKKLMDFIQNYERDNFKVPENITKILKEILLKNSKNETQIMEILSSINSLKLEQ
jgi:predicted transcriptional regulator